MRGLYYGAPNEAIDILTPFINLEGANVRFRYTSFLDAITQIGRIYPDSEIFKPYGRFVNRLYSREELRAITDIISERPPGSKLASINLYAMGGAVQEVSSNSTAFYYRNSDYILLIETLWEDPIFARDNDRWIKQHSKYIKSITKGSYVNFPYGGLKNYERAYYGGNVERLRNVKKLYDPCNVFRFPQSIRPAKETDKIED